jgi:hypothetical protein
MLSQEACLTLVVSADIAVENGTETIDTLIELRKVITSTSNGQLEFVQFFIFTATCWAIKFSLLAFYARLFYLYTRFVV